MSLEFGPINREELRQAAELAARAFSDYEYFTNWFPNDDERAFEYNDNKMGSWSLKKVL